MADSARDNAARAWIEVDFDPDPGFKLNFDGLQGHEQLGRPFQYDIDMSSGTYQTNIKKLVGTSCTLWMAQSQEGAEDRYLNGIVTRVHSAGLTGGAYRYKVEVRPWIWLLTRVIDSQIFQEKSPFQIITQLFRDNNFSEFRDNRQASAGDTVLEYCVQYNESTYDFVMRLMEQYGIYYFFEHEKGHHKLVFADDPNAHMTLPNAMPFVFDQTEYRSVSDHIWVWATDLLLESGKVTYQDYNFTTPTADMEAKSLKKPDHPHNELGVYEYPGPYDKADVGKKLTDIRMQAIAQKRLQVAGESNSRKLHPGIRFKVEKHTDSNVNRDHLVIRADFSISITEAASTIEGETVDSYHVNFHCIPGDVPFRLDRATPRPMIRGPQTAKVVGPSGEEIHTDEYGRVKVKFHWDYHDAPEDKRSCWIRVAQTSAGSGWGSIFIPRVGQEVVVEFLEGNPDRPLVTGVVYNANMKVPYALPDNKTQTGIKTASSKGESGNNELRFEDKAGAEEVYFHAQYDYNKVVKNNETVKVKKDTTTTVEEGNRSVTVSQGNDTHKVDTGNREATIKGNDKITVSSGNHSIDVSAGESKITASTSITLTVGGNSITIDSKGVKINGAMVDVKASASMSLDGGGALTAKGGMISVN